MNLFCGFVCIALSYEFVIFSIDLHDSVGRYGGFIQHEGDRIFNL